MPRHSAFSIQHSAFGMTLVEMLLAVTLFSTLMASVTGLLRSGLQSQLGWGQALVPYQQMERAFQRLEQDLGSAQPFFGVPFMGEERTLECARVEPQLTEEISSAPAWVRLVYRLEDAADGLWLVREAYARPDQGAGQAALRRERLVKLSQGRFLFGKMDANGQLAWAPSWDGTLDGLPRLVKLDCALAGVEHQPAVELSRVIRNPAGNLPALESP